MQEPIISIIIPTYNVESYLPACLTSLREQDFQDFEGICIDDGSTDNTIKILKEGTSLEIYLNDTLISTKTITDITGYLGWKTHSHSSRSVTFKDFGIME